MEQQKVTQLKTWVQVPVNSDFTIYNLPFGIFKNKRLSPRVGIAIGDKVVDLSVLQEMGFFADIKLADGVFLTDSLNAFIALGKATIRKVRNRVQQLLGDDNSDLKDHQSRGKIIIGRKEAEMMMPVKIGDCTGFISRTELRLFQDKGANLAINRVPVGYQVKSSTILKSGTSLYRPKGLRKEAGQQPGDFGPSNQLDFQLEVGMVIGKPSKLGESVPVSEGEDYVFGLVLINNWTARDIQALEKDNGTMFLSKNFGFSISPWIVTMDALEQFKVNAEPGQGELPAYLRTEDDQRINIQLQASISSEKGEKVQACETNFKYADFSMAQLIAYQTSNGANLEIGDLLASGASSRPEENQYASLSELYHHSEAMEGENSFLNDGDIVSIKGYCEKEETRIGFGVLSTKILPSKK